MDIFITVTILVATALVGVRTYYKECHEVETVCSASEHSVTERFDFAENVISGIFIVEVVVKMLAKGPIHYFRVYWNMFDFFIVVMNFLPFPIGLIVFRMLRMLRIAKVVKVFPTLQVILVGLQQGLKSIFYTGVLWVPLRDLDFCQRIPSPPTPHSPGQTRLGIVRTRARAAC
eukprot:SAG11_NODE_4464_length_1886_cov_2.049804_2_plen_174_part_00